jgi:hypothetical protein
MIPRLVVKEQSWWDWLLGYEAKDDSWCERQRHLKYICSKQIRDTDIDKLLKRKQIKTYKNISPLIYNTLIKIDELCDLHS